MTVPAVSRVDARARIFSLLARSGPVSRADLARRTLLAPSTVSAVISEMQAAQLVVEPAPGVNLRPAGAIGRPPVLVALHRNAGVAIGLDFGKRHVRVVVSDLAHSVLAERHDEIDADLPAPVAIAHAAGLVDEVLVEAGVDREDVVGVGMGLPGPVHGPTGELGDSTILPGWVGVRAAEAMSDALRHEVEVENDANLGALSEWMWGAGRGADNMAYLKVATGIGAGFIIRGRPYTGVSGTAGEIGHTVVDPSGPICRCGNRGCLETVAGSSAVLAALRGTLGPDVTVAQAIAGALEGHTGCVRAITDAGSAIGSSVATLCNLVNPERIVVGGDLAAAGSVLIGPLREALRRGAVRSAAEDVTVVEGTLGERAEVLGAVALVLRRGPEILRRCDAVAARRAQDARRAARA
jgi:predicted NBD/HSP70 family sugar kinase